MHNSIVVQLFQNGEHPSTDHQGGFDRKCTLHKSKQVSYWRSEWLDAHVGWPVFSDSILEDLWHSVNLFFLKKSQEGDFILNRRNRYGPPLLLEHVPDATSQVDHLIDYSKATLTNLGDYLIFFVNNIDVLLMSLHQKNKRVYKKIDQNSLK